VSATLVAVPPGGKSAEKNVMTNNKELIGGGAEVACWPLIPKFAGSNLAEAV
jgi:hypothetical protein